MPRKPRFEPFGPALAADDATIVGQVTLREDVSIWYGTVVRGDVASITIGARTNIQDLSMIHPQTDEPITIGADVTFGHGVIFHGRAVGDLCLLGMRATIMRGVVIGRHCLVAAGALLTEGKVFPDGSVIMGSPARVVRPVTPAEIADFQRSAHYYVTLARRHLDADAVGPTTP